jgi:predicted metal-dependent hydrolase
MRLLRVKTKSANSRSRSRVKHPIVAPQSAPRTKEELFAHGVHLFNTLYFFQAHEAWEEIWLHTPPPEKTFLQGLIQVTAALHHHSRKNLRGTKSLLRNGLDKLEQFPEIHRGLQLERLRAAVRAWLKWLHEKGSQRKPALPKIKMDADPRRRKL